MAWIEDALQRSTWNIDDLFKFDSEGRVISRCANFYGKETDPEKIIKICHHGCNHESGNPIEYEAWKEMMKDLFEERWPDMLEEEAFFREPENIPGGEKLLERTKARKDKRAAKFHRPRRNTNY